MTTGSHIYRNGLNYFRDSKDRLFVETETGWERVPGDEIPDCNGKVCDADTSGAS